MATNLSENGYLSEEELSGRLPSVARMRRGPVAVIECTQDIPCNPCEAACPAGAITVGQPITSVPVLDEDKCKGCGICVPRCPGLAIFVLDCSKPGAMGTIQMPYEYVPLPEAEEAVLGLDRRGQPVGVARVEKVTEFGGCDHTALVTIAVPKDLVNRIRNIMLLRES
jgi:Fe-S-cluster-containing hydrogenase component 2